MAKKSSKTLSAMQLGGGFAMAQAIQFVGFLLYPIFYRDVDFGQYAIFMAWLLIISEVNNAKLDQVMMLVEIEERERLFKGTWLLNTVLALCILIFVYFLQNCIDSSFYWLPLASLLMGLKNAGLSFLNKLGAYKQMGTTKLIYAISMVLAGLALGYLGYAKGIIIGTLVALLVSVIFLASQVNLRRIASKPVQLIPLLRTYQSYVLSLTSGSLLNNISKNLSYILLEIFFPIGWVGQFYFLFKIINAPVDLYNYTLNKLYFEEITETKEYKNNTINVMKLGLYAGSLSLFALWLMGEVLLPIHYYDKVHEVMFILPILIIWELITVIVVPVTPLLTYLKKLKFIFFYQLIFSITRIGAILLGAYWLSFHSTLFIFILVGVVFNLFLFYYLFQLAKK